MSEERFIYLSLEIIYLKRYNREISLNSFANEDLFPCDWGNISDYKTKIDIITEANDKGILIIDTDGYQEIIEGVKMPKR